MAVDVVAVCAVATNNQASQSLAIVLSVLFSLYTIVSIALSALTIYTSSQQRMDAPAKPAATSKLQSGVSLGELGGAPLVGLRQ